MVNKGTTTAVEAILDRMPPADIIKEEEKRKLRKAEYEAGKNDGIKIGREEEKRKIANSLFKEGDSIEKVARILCESEETIRGWVNEKMDIKVE